MSEYAEVVDIETMRRYMANGVIDPSSALGKNGDVYGLDYDVNGRFCLCAIGSPQHMKQKEVKA